MLRRVIALNNNGVMTLYSGRFQEAVLCFRHAAEYIRALAATQPTFSSLSWIHGVSLGHCPLSSMTEEEIMKISPHNPFSIYRTAFTIPKDCEVDVQDPTLSSIVFYNLGLALHMTGYSSLNEFRACMSEALENYKLSLSILKARGEYPVGLFATVLGCITNLGQIYSHFWKTNEAQSCLRSLENLLESDATLSLPEADCLFFFSELSFSGANTYSLAPAA